MDLEFLTLNPQFQMQSPEFCQHRQHTENGCAYTELEALRSPTEREAATTAPSSVEWGHGSVQVPAQSVRYIPNTRAMYDGLTEEEEEKEENKEIVNGNTHTTLPIPASLPTPNCTLLSSTPLSSQSCFQPLCFLFLLVVSTFSAGWYHRTFGFFDQSESTLSSPWIGQHNASRLIALRFVNYSFLFWHNLSVI